MAGKRRRKLFSFANCQGVDVESNECLKTRVNAWKAGGFVGIGIKGDFDVIVAAVLGKRGRFDLLIEKG